MTFLKRRNRMVVFRVTEDEYDNLKSACAERGARNVSDFARSELLNSADREHAELMHTLSELQGRLDRLERLLQRLFRSGGNERK